MFCVLLSKVAREIFNKSVVLSRFLLGYDPVIKLCSQLMCQIDGKRQMAGETTVLLGGW